MEKYNNKFHKMKFESDVKEDMKENSVKLPNNIQNERISDDFSNEQATQYSNKKD